MMRIRDLNRPECIKLIADNRLGRLACARDGQPYIVPFWYAYADSHIYAFSMPGKKIDCMRANPFVSVLVEEHERGREWKSVIVDGRYEELSDKAGCQDERDHAWRLLSKHPNWWEPGALKPTAQALSDHSPHVFFRILFDRISGRATSEH